MYNLLMSGAARRPGNALVQLARFAAVLGACGAVVAYGPSARAETVSDPTGDFLAPFSAAHPNQRNGDLDVASAGAVFDGQFFHLSATMNGDIGTTEGGLYVWGVNRGEGIAVFTTLPNPIGEGVVFDSFIRINQDGSGMIVRDFLPGGLDTSVVNLTPGQVQISGRRLDLTVALADLPTRGLDPLQYGFNIWPRVDGISSNDQIADFAPNARNITASVPEPTAWALMIVGFGFAGTALRRSRTAVA